MERVRVKKEKVRENRKNQTGSVAGALRAAFPFTLPVFAGYLFLGFSYGLYAHSAGLAFWYPVSMAALVYGGSLEFVLVSMLCAPFSPVTVFVAALVIQARHLFYGLAMLGRYQRTGWKKFFLIFGMSDETFAINCSTAVPEGADRGWFYLWVTWLDQLYWIAGAALGALTGMAIRVPVKGIEYIMTAMFVCIFLDRIRRERQTYTALIGLGSSILSLAIFGPDRFLIPAMVLILALLAVFQKPISQVLERRNRYASLSESDLPERADRRRMSDEAFDAPFSESDRSERSADGAAVRAADRAVEQENSGTNGRGGQKV